MRMSWGRFWGNRSQCAGAASTRGSRSGSEMEVAEADGEEEAQVDFFGAEDGPWEHL